MPQGFTRNGRRELTCLSLEFGANQKPKVETEN